MYRVFHKDKVVLKQRPTFLPKPGSPFHFNGELFYLPSVLPQIMQRHFLPCFGCGHGLPGSHSLCLQNGVPFLLYLQILRGHPTFCHTVGVSWFFQHQESVSQICKDITLSSADMTCAAGRIAPT